MSAEYVNVAETEAQAVSQRLREAVSSSTDLFARLNSIRADAVMMARGSLGIEAAAKEAIDAVRDGVHVMSAASSLMTRLERENQQLREERVALQRENGELREEIKGLRASKRKPYTRRKKV